MTAMLENIRNAITRLPMDWLWRNLGGHIPSYSRHVSHDAVAMATAVGRCLATAHCTFSSYGRLEAECVNKICWNLVYNSKLGPSWQSRNQILKYLKFKMADSRHVRKYSKCHNSPTNGPSETNLGGHIPSCPRHVPHNLVAMATAVDRQRRIKHSAVMGVWRLEAERVNQFL